MNWRERVLARCASGVEWWYALLGRHRAALTVILLVMAAGSSLLSTRIHWQASVLRFFSAHSATVRDVTATQNETGLVNRVRLDVHLAGPANVRQLAAGIHALAVKLRATGAFRWVWTGARTTELIAAQRRLIQLGPVLLSTRQLQTLEGRVNPDYVQKRFATVVRRIAQPDGELQAAVLVNDPLGMNQLIRQRLAALNPMAGAHLAHGLLLSRDNRHAMMVLAPKFPPANTPASNHMIQQLHKAIAAVQRDFPAMRVWAVGSYLHYADNARSIRADVTWISLLGTVLVAAAIGLFFRRWTTLLICMLPPMVGLGTALGLAGLLEVRLPLLVLGFAGLLCGSTTDYGIQLLAALNRRAAEAPQWHPRMAALATRDLYGAISMSVCTSVTGYAALGLSSAPGVRALGLFIAGATLCIWLVTFLVLPGYFGPWLIRAEPAGGSAGQRLSQVSRISRPLFWSGGAIFLITCAWMATGAATASYNHHPQGLDDISPRTRSDQTRFDSVWGDRHEHDVVLIQEKSAAGALRRLARVTETLENLKHHHLIAQVFSPARLLPDASTVGQRSAAWRAFWTPTRRQQMRRLIAQAAATTGLNAEAWDPWLAALAHPPRVASAAQRIAQSPAALLPGLLDIRPTRTTIGVAVLANEQLPLRSRGQWVRVLRQSFPQISIIDGEVLLYKATAQAQHQTARLFPWVLLLIVVPLWIYFRRIDLAVLACLSMVVGFVWLLGAATKFCGGLNLMSMVPILFTMGVAVDYGIYAAGDPRQKWPDGQPDRRAATMLCALTTLLGTGVLAISQQPVLRWIGITLVCGLSGGYFTSLFLVGPLTGWLFRPRTGRWKVRFDIANRVMRVALGLAVAGLVLFFIVGCAATAPPLPRLRTARGPAPSPAAVRQSLAAIPTRLAQSFFATLAIDHRRVSMIGRLHVVSARHFQLTAASEFGPLVFMVRRHRPAADMVQTAAGVAPALAIGIAQDVVIALLPPQAKVSRQQRRTPVRIYRHFTEMSYTDALGNMHRGRFIGPRGHLHRADITLVSHQHLQVLYTRYNTAGVPRKLFLRPSDGGWLLIINFTGGT